jgi:hypothetical protein
MKELKNLEVGEKARVCEFRVFTGIELHPDYPMEV